MIIINNLIINIINEMKKLCSILLLIIINLLSYTQVNNDWQWSHPKPQGNDIRYIKMLAPNNWVAVGYTGTLIRSTNAGLNWLVYTNYFGTYQAFLGQGKNIYGADFFGNTGIAAGTQGWIARTTNGGINWDSVGSSAGTTALWNASFGDANTVYIGGNSGMVLKSTNAGLSWTTAASPSGNANRTIFALDANNVFTGSLNGTIYKSTNGGSSWTAIVTGSTTSIIFGIYFFNSNTGIVTGGTNYFRYTTDGGANWNVPSVPAFGAELRVYGRKSPDEIYILGDLYNLYKSTDYAASWSTIPYQYPGQIVGLTSNTMDVSGNTLIVGGVNGLLNISINNGTSWTGISNVLTNYNIFDVAYNSQSGKVWAVGNTATGMNNSILFSTNRGISWAVQNSLSSAYLRCIHMLDENTGWISGNSGLVLKTTNGGINWNQVNIPGSSGQSLTYVQFANLSTGWVFGYSGGQNLFKTTDAGNTWQTQTYGSTDNGARWATMLNASTGYYVSYNITNSRIFKTTNGGDNWTEQTYPNPGNLWSIKMINTNTGYVCGDGGRLFRTTDGSAWVTVTAPTTNNYTSTDWYDIDNGVLGAGSGFAAITTNSGQSWLVKNTGGTSVWSMRMTHPDTIWCAQGFGFLFKYVKGSAIGITEWTNEIPESYFLKQNYPNPFNPATTIEFGLKKAGIVSIKVFDVTGKLVDVIIDNVQFNQGTIKTAYNASKLSSGVYFYTLEVDNIKIDARKMILMK